jgi:hypothetical protein
VPSFEKLNAFQAFDEMPQSKFLTQTESSPQLHVTARVILGYFKFWYVLLGKLSDIGYIEA